MFRFDARELMKIVFMIGTVLFLNSCQSSKEGFIIVTETLSSAGNPDFFSDESWRYQNQTRLVLINPEQKHKSVKVITSDFYSACSPCVSFDGKSLVFAAQKKQGDIWQIWELNLHNLKTKQITSLESNSVDPSYLPNGNIIFSHIILNDSLKAGHSLFSCDKDGNGLTRITFNPHTYLSSSVLKDGRVIAINHQVYPVISNQNIMVLRPDGTKNELFYRGEKGIKFFCRPKETNDGKIVFVESSHSAGITGRLVSVNYNRPLHSHKVINESANGSFNSVSPVGGNKLLVSFKPSGGERYSLYEFDTDKSTLGDPLYSGEGNVIDVVYISQMEIPRKLPSEVDTGVKTGLMLCQNINLTGLISPETGYAPTSARKIEIIGLNESFGISEVENDGSVYLKIAADTPFRIQTLDTLGNVVNGPGGWYYLRPNERRGCVGCHEDNEIAPANRYSKAVSKNPVVFPIHFAGIKEKEVELE